MKKKRALVLALYVIAASTWSATVCAEEPANNEWRIDFYSRAEVANTSPQKYQWYFEIGTPLNTLGLDPLEAWLPTVYTAPTLPEGTPFRPIEEFGGKRLSCSDEDVPGWYTCKFYITDYSTPQVAEQLRAQQVQLIVKAGMRAARSPPQLLGDCNMKGFVACSQVGSALCPNSAYQIGSQECPKVEVRLPAVVWLGSGEETPTLSDSQTSTKDGDGDGVVDTLDNCPSVFNSDQENADGDLYGNACDPFEGVSPPELESGAELEGVDRATSGSGFLLAAGTPAMLSMLTLLGFAAATIALTRRKK